MIYSGAIYNMASFLQKDGFKLKKLFCETYTISCAKLIELAVYVANADGKRCEELDIIDLCLDKNIAGGGKAIEDCLVVHANDLPIPTKEGIINENAYEIWRGCGSKMNFGKSYHPKLLLACFQNQEEPSQWYYKLQVGTANLTGSRAIETAIIVEGGSNDALQNPNGVVVYDFYETLYRKALRQESVPVELKALKKTAFCAVYKPVQQENLKGELSEITFAYCFGNFDVKKENNIQYVLGKEMSNSGEAIAVYSPFLKFDEKGQTYLDEKSKNICYYTNLTQHIYDRWDQIKDKVRYGTNAEPFLHAKIYLWKENQDELAWAQYRLWMGSANASENGWENNVEFMIGANWKIKKVKEYIKPELIGKKDLNGKALAPCLNFSNIKPERAMICESDEEIIVARGLLECCRVRVLPIIKDNKITLIVTVVGKNFDTNAELIFKDRRNQPIKSIKLEYAYSFAVAYEKENFPVVAGMLMVEVKVNEKVYPFSIDVEGMDFLGKVYGELPKARPMYRLLKELKSIHAIPKCAVRDFSNGGDDLYERLCSYFASYHYEDSVDGYKAVMSRVKQIQAVLQDRDAEIFMKREEKEKLDRLSKMIVDLYGEDVKTWD